MKTRSKLFLGLVVAAIAAALVLPAAAIAAAGDSSLGVPSGNTPLKTGGDSEMSYPITVVDNDAGAVKAPSSSTEGSSVLIEIKNVPGYQVDHLNVRSEYGLPITLTGNEDGTFSFWMPPCGVVITPVYMSAENTCASAIFSDFDPDAWYHPYVDYVVTKGLMGGYEGTDLFGYGDVTTRGMIVTVLWRQEGEPWVGRPDAIGYELPFTDVVVGAWYYNAVDWAQAYRIVTGYEGTTLFGPNDEVTREQFATVLFRYATYKELSTDDRADLSAFEDADQVSDWAFDAMSWANAEGIITGRDGKYLAPGESCTRAEMAAILARFFEANEGEDGMEVR